MLTEAGTNPSITLSADGRTVTSFGGDVNPACLARTGAYTDPVFAMGNGIVCEKRAIRANAGIRQGEFRYFEGFRLTVAQNFGFGITTRAADINPLCCFVGSFAPTAPHPLSSPSSTVNTFGGEFVSLVGQYGFSSEESTATSYYGMAVDYTGTNPVVFWVTRSGMGAMLVNRLVTTGFNGSEAVPLMFGNLGVNAATAGVATLNFGQTPFHYDQTALRTQLRASLIANGATDAEATAKLNQFTTGVVTR